MITNRQGPTENSRRTLPIPVSCRFYPLHQQNVAVDESDTGKSGTVPDHELGSQDAAVATDRLTVDDLDQQFGDLRSIHARVSVYRRERWIDRYAQETVLEANDSRKIMRISRCVRIPGRRIEQPLGNGMQTGCGQCLILVDESGGRIASTHIASVIAERCLR